MHFTLPVKIITNDTGYIELMVFNGSINAVTSVP